MKPTKIYYKDCQEGLKELGITDGGIKMNEDTLEEIRIDKMQRMERPGKLLVQGHLFLAYFSFKERILENFIRIENKRLELAKLKHERKQLKKG